jgi:hypothetical protein
MMLFSLHSWPAWIRKLGPACMSAAQRGAMRGALRGVSTMQRATTKAKAVNVGTYRLGWKWGRIPDGVRIYNAVAYAAIIEWGRRKQGGMPPTLEIANWAQRKLGLSREDAKHAAFAIARKIQKRGLRPRKVMTKQVHRLQKDFLTEVAKEIEKEVRRP